MARAKLLEGKRVFVSGGSSGLGRAICTQAALEGASVAFIYAANSEGAEKTRQAIESAGARAHVAQVSVLDKEGLQRVAREVDKAWGGIDILINNAGINQPVPFSLLEEKDWDLMMDTNAKGLYLTTHAVLPTLMRQRAGAILNISSLAGLKLLESPVHYSASKAAVRGFTESLAVEVSRYGVRVNCLAPGLLDDGMSSMVPEYKFKDYLRVVALARRGKVEEVAKCATFLVSDRNTYMNGTTLFIDGGISPMRVLVFGGTGALGSEICRKLVRDGAQLAFTYFSNDKGARALERELPGMRAFQCDLRDREQLKRVVEEATKYLGGLSALAFAVAGSDRKIHLEIPDLTAEKMATMLDLHVSAPFAACQFALGALKKSKGANITFVGSLAGSKAVQAPVHFAAAKAALHGVAETMSKELGEHDIRVNVIAPGLLDGGSSVTLSPLWREGYKLRNLMHRTGKMSEIAEVVAWFSLENTYVTGQVVVVDGGI